MSRLTAALTDRARIVQTLPTGERIDGRTPFTEVRGEWMHARLVVLDEREGEDGHGQRTVLVRAQLVVPGDAEVSASDRVEVRSPTQGDASWRVVADPVRAASRRRVRALVLVVERIAEPAREAVT